MRKTTDPAAIALLLRGSTFTLYGGSVLTRVNRRAVEQPIDILSRRAVAAKQAMLTQDPQVAALRDRLVGRLGHIVGIGEPLLHAGIEQLGQFVGVETEQRPVDAGVLQLGQFERQQLEVPLGQLAGLVVGDAVGADLLGRQVAWRRAPAPSRARASVAAFQRVCPQTMTPASSTTIGWRKPNRWIDSATASTAASFSRGGCVRTV
jgi:hypothetical protein